MWIVKLGGSLLDYPGLKKWLEVLSNTAAPMVIVPGGGPLANAVRNAQMHRKFTDAVGHHMGLLAMEQNAYYLSRLNPKLEPCDNWPAMQKSLANGKLPVWLPAQMVMADPDIVRDWTVTSDSLSVWLASRIQCDGLILVKSCPLSGKHTTAKQLSQKGIVDQSFPQRVAAAEFPVFITQRDKYHQLDSILAGNSFDAIKL